MWLVSELFEPAGELLSSHPLGSLSVRHERSQSPRDFLAAAVGIRNHSLPRTRPWQSPLLRADCRCRNRHRGAQSPTRFLDRGIELMG
jgi:hypothetical protein